MTLHLDRSTAEMLRDAVAMLTAVDGDAGNMLKELEEFLAVANASDREG